MVLDGLIASLAGCSTCLSTTHVFCAPHKQLDPPVLAAAPVLPAIVPGGAACQCHVQPDRGPGKAGRRAVAQRHRPTAWLFADHNRVPTRQGRAAQQVCCELHVATFSCSWLFEHEASRFCAHTNSCTIGRPSPVSLLFRPSGSTANPMARIRCFQRPSLTRQRCTSAGASSVPCARSRICTSPVYTLGLLAHYIMYDGCALAVPPAARVVNDPLNSRFSFVELTNPEAYAVDISSWRLQGAWAYDFAAGERSVPVSPLSRCPDKNKHDCKPVRAERSCIAAVPCVTSGMMILLPFGAV